MDRKTLLGCLTALLLLTGCWRKHHLSVGSKNFTEQVILGEIIAQHLENRLHRTIDRKLNLGGTLLAHQALLAGDIDLYPEYTGTAFTDVLKRTGVTDPMVVLDRVRTEYASTMHLDWLNPLGFYNSFALVVRGDEARKRHLATLSDAAADAEGFTLGAGYEFLTRPDGYPLLNAAYPIKWNAAPKSMDLGLLYTALNQWQVTMVAGSSTDGVLKKFDFTILKDDKQAFPPYQACIVARSEVLAADPDLRKALSELSGRISDQTMVDLNYDVDVNHRQVVEVAREFLKKAGLH